MRVTKGSAFYSNVDGKGRHSGNLNLTMSEELGKQLVKGTGETQLMIREE